jgi:dTDP-4-dehydrorhamnose reductase
MLQASYWILGSHGQLGRAWLAELARAGLPARGFSRSELDLEDSTSIDSLFHALKPGDSVLPTAVILTGAYTAVDLAEKPEERARVFRVNADAPGRIATHCARLGIPFVHYSTDYVYPGEGEAPRLETAPTGPLNVYGESKLAGERAVEAAFRENRATPWLVFRTSWVYDAVGKNFYRTMLRLFGERESLSVVADQWGAPSYAPDLARASLESLSRAGTDPEDLSGIYHLVHRGETTWHGFAAAILERARAAGLVKLQTLSPLQTAAYPTPARRPLNSRLSTAKLQAQLGVRLPTWEDGLDACWKSDPARSSRP